MGSPGKSKKTGSSRKGASLHKRGVRKKFRARHIDQVWEDVRKPDGVLTTTHGPVGTTTVAELDDDVPGGGKHYCEYCSRYFVTDRAKIDHERTKQHKKRFKELQGPKPHSQADADWAAGLGMPDNGNHMS